MRAVHLTGDFPVRISERPGVKSPGLLGPPVSEIRPPGHFKESRSVQYFSKSSRFQVLPAFPSNPLKSPRHLNIVSVLSRTWGFAEIPSDSKRRFAIDNIFVFEYKKANTGAFHKRSPKDLFGFPGG
jgi:hypothetical protein